MKPKYNTVRFHSQSLVTAIVVCFGASVSQGATNLWTGTTDSDWNTATNWNAGHVPEKAVFDEDAVINTNSGNLATIGATILKTPKDIIVGNAATGILNHISGDAQTGAGNWLKVGMAGATGTYNLANTATAGLGITGFAQGAGNMVVAGEIQIGQGSGSTGTLNMNTTGLLSSGNAFFVGFVGITSGSGVLNMESGTLNVGGNFNVSDGGIINVGNAWSTTTTGTMNMTGGTVSSTGEFRVGNARGKGIFNFSSGTLNTKTWTSIGRTGGHGTVNMTGGTWTKSGGGDFSVGDGYQGAAKGEFYVSGSSIVTNTNLLYVGNGGSTATMAVSDTASVTSAGTIYVGGGGSNGSLTVEDSASFRSNNEFFVGNGGGTIGNMTITGGTVTSNNWIVIGRAGGNGTATMSGGTWNKNATDSNFIIGSNTGSVGLLTMTGGTVNVPDNGPIDRGMTWLGENDNSQGTLTMSGSALFKTERFVLGNSGTAIGIMNLNGGDIQTAHILGGSATARVYFNGTNILATAGSNDFIQNLDVAEIKAGGLKVNSNNFTLTATQLLTGVGGIEKTGFGTLTLTGANNNAGPTNILNGKLALTTAADAAGGGAGAVTVGNDARFGLTQSADNDPYNTSGATFGNSLDPFDSYLDLNLGNFAGNPTVAPLNVTGLLTMNGNVKVNVADANIIASPTPIPLVSYNSRGGDGFFSLDTLPDGVIAELVDNGTSPVILNVTRANDPYWNGPGSQWNTTDANWLNEFGGLATTFATGDPAMFDDRVAAAGPITVDLNVAVEPGGSGVTFNNVTKAYTLTGTGKITGTTGLLKSGAGSVTIATANDYIGETTITAGTINIATFPNTDADSPIGRNNLLLLNGGTLNYTGGITTTDRGFTVSAVNGAISTTNALTMTGPVSASGGGLIKLGAGNLTLTNDSIILSSSGRVSRVNGGTLTLTGPSALPVYANGELWVGSTTDASGNLVLQDRNLTVSSWFTLGRGNGNTGILSTFTANNSVIQSGNLSVGFNGDLGSNDSDQTITLTNSTWTNNGLNLFGESQNTLTNVNFNGSSFTGAGATRLAMGANSVCNMTLSGASTYTPNAQFLMSTNATGTSNLIIQDNSAVQSHAGYFSIGDAGTAVVTVKGNGILSTTGIDLNVADNANSKGTLKIQDNATVTAGTFFWGKASGSTATVEISGGSFTGGASEISRAGSTTNVTQTGGTVNFGRMWFGQGGNGTWAQSAGQTNCNNWLVIGRTPGSVIAWNVSGGTLAQTGVNEGIILAEDGTGTLTISGTELGGPGVVDSAGGKVDIATRSNGNGTLNLNALGTLRARQVAEFNNGTSALNFNGGTLFANSGADGDFLFGIDTATILAGGATIDANGQQFQIRQSFQGSGNLLVTDSTGLGTGGVAIDGANTFSGTTTATACALGGSGSLAGPLVISPNAVLAPGHGVGTLGTLTAGPNTTISGTYAFEIDGAASDQLKVNGPLNVSAATLSVTQLNPASGPGFVVATYTGTPPAAFASAPTLTGYTLVYDFGGNKIAYVQNGASAYSLWALNNIISINPGADATPTGDPDNDGLANSTEFALNSVPLSGATSGKVRGTVAPMSVDGPALVLTLPVRNGATFSGSPAKVSTEVDGVIYTIQGSDQLTTWDLFVEEVGAPDKAAIESTMPPLDAGWTYRTFRSPGATTGDPTDFLRAVITTP